MSLSCRCCAKYASVESDCRCAVVLSVLAACSVLMDVDFMRRRGHIGVRLGPSVRPKFLQQIRADVELLQSNQFMDYSMLLGIAKFPKKELSSVSASRRGSSNALAAASAAAAGGAGREPSSALFSTLSQRSSFDLDSSRRDSDDYESEDDADWSRTDKVRAFDDVFSSKPRECNLFDEYEEEREVVTVFNEDLIKRGFPSTDAEGTVIGDEVRCFYVPLCCCGAMLLWRA